MTTPSADITAPRLASTASAAESIRHVAEWRQLVEDYRPLALSLEWQLSTLHWIAQGVTPFVDNTVPFLVNNNGRLSADAAAMLFENCREAPPGDGEIAVLELGAGTGLFARYFLDAFRLLCERESRDFYERLCYHVTDRSPRTVEQWAEWKVFGEHTGHVAMRVADAGMGPALAGRPVRAVFCNYVLDILPSAVVRRTEHGWEQLCVRTWLPNDDALLRQYTSLTIDEIRSQASSIHRERKSQLLPLVPLLELETEFRPVDRDGPPGLDQLTAAPNSTFVYNFGAIDCIEALLGALDPDGFVLVNDYGTVGQGDVALPAPAQRFGSTTAIGLNFPRLEERVRRSGRGTVSPEGDDGRAIHARLFLGHALPLTRQTFAQRFAASAIEHVEEPAERARRELEAGRFPEALAHFRAAIERCPCDWHLIGEAASFVSEHLYDHASGVALAQAAIALNPCYSATLWNVLGECWSRTGRGEDAHECYRQAHRIHPRDVRTHLNLARSWLERGQPCQCLEATACGLANDAQSIFRHQLLETQQRAIAALSLRWNREREIASRRSWVGLR